MPPKMKIRLQLNLLGVDQVILAVLVACVAERLHRVEVEWEVVHQDPADSTDWGTWNEILFHIPGQAFVGSELHRALDLETIQARYVLRFLTDLIAGSSAQIRRRIEHNWLDIKNLNQTLYSTVFLATGKMDTTQHDSLRRDVLAFVEFVAALIAHRISELQ